MLSQSPIPIDSSTCGELTHENTEIMLSYLVGLQIGLTFADLGLILPQLCDQTTQNIHNML